MDLRCPPMCFAYKYATEVTGFLYCPLVAKLCLTLCDPMDWSPPDSSVHEISQSRILKWVAIPFSSRSSRPRDLRWSWYTNNRNKVHNKCHVLESSQSHPSSPLPPCPWKNCLPWNRSPGPKGLETAGLAKGKLEFTHILPPPWKETYPSCFHFFKLIHLFILVFEANDFHFHKT